MVITGVVAGVIVAVIAIASKVYGLWSWMSDRAREKDKERAERARLAADLEDLRKRILAP